MDKNIVEICKKGSVDGTMAFPEVVRRLIEAGVERYRVDLILRESIYFDAAGQTHALRGLFKEKEEIANDFSSSGVRDALKAVQGGEIDYLEFLRRIMRAGCVAYEVFITGRRVVYWGRTGEFHLEPFPIKK